MTTIARFKLKMIWYSIRVQMLGIDDEKLNPQANFQLGKTCLLQTVNLCLCINEFR